MLALGGVWLSIGVLVALSTHPAMHIPSPWNWVLGGLITLAALIAFGLGLALARRSRWGFYGSVAFLGASALAVMFDQIGWVDVMFAAANILTLILLLRARDYYLRA